MQGGEEKEEDPSTFAVTDDGNINNNGNAPIDLNQNDHAWPTAEGYTPLGDVFHLGSILVAMPPEDDDDENDNDDNSNIINSFVADPVALFGNINSTNHDNVYGVISNDGNDVNEEEGNNNANSLQANTHAAAIQQQEQQIVGSAGFRGLADTALLALENDYEMTLRGEVRPSLMDSHQQHIPSMSLLDASSFSNNNSNNNAATTNTTGDSNDTNFADFDSMNNTTANTKSAGATKTPELPKIDTEAVQKAVAGIITKSTSLQSKLQKWQSEKDENKYQFQQQKEHSLIPAIPLKAFAPNKKTPKAIKATANLSRSATIADCLHRLSHLLKCQERLAIHVVGADHVECSSTKQVQTTFAPLIRWINANLYSPQHVDILLIGPNVPTHMHDNNNNNRTPILLLASQQQQQQQQQSKQRLHSATAACQQANYHDWLESLQQKKRAANSGDAASSRASFSSLPDLVVCFNAGIWGYDEWKPTIRAICQCSSASSSSSNNKRIPFVVTSYTLEEAEDDHDVIQEVVEEETQKQQQQQQQVEQQEDNRHSKNEAVHKTDQQDNTPCKSSSSSINSSNSRSSSIGIIWGPELNYFGSKQKRETATAVEGREYRENAAWQAWRL